MNLKTAMENPDQELIFNMDNRIGVLGPISYNDLKGVLAHDLGGDLSDDEIEMIIDVAEIDIRAYPHY